MPEFVDREDERELLAGTWFSMALIIELLIASGTIDRDFVVATFSRFETQANGNRRVALSAIRRMIASPAAKDDKPRRTRISSGCVRYRRCQGRRDDPRGGAALVGHPPDHAVVSGITPIADKSGA